MRINIRAFTLGAAVSAAVIFIACWTITAILPQFSMRMAEAMLHADLGGISWSITWPGLVLGTLWWAVWSGLTAALLGWIYNLAAPALPAA